MLIFYPGLKFQATVSHRADGSTLSSTARAIGSVAYCKDGFQSIRLLHPPPTSIISTVAILSFALKLHNSWFAFTRYANHYKILFTLDFGIHFLLAG
ncbi:MAG: hypothetical protein ACTHMM_21495 [Agriterribacter sp.]